jgi:hypothetical protein
LSDESDGEHKDSSPSKSKHKSGVIEEKKGGFSPRNNINITPIVEEEIFDTEGNEVNDPDENPPRVQLATKRTTSLLKDIDMDDGSVSNASRDNQSNLSFGNIVTKDSTTPIRKSSTRSREYKRVSTNRSDSSIGSKNFKFKHRVGK